MKDSSRKALANAAEKAGRFYDSVWGVALRMIIGVGIGGLAGVIYAGGEIGTSVICAVAAVMYVFTVALESRLEVDKAFRKGFEIGFVKAWKWSLRERTRGDGDK